MPDAGLARAETGTASRWLTAPIEFAAALLVVIEMAMLLAGVVSRHGFHRPIVWADEFAGSAFLWMSLLGAVVALLRGEHMRFGGLVARMRPVWQRRAGVLALLLPPALDCVEDESFVTMPNLGIPVSWRVGAIPIGLGLMPVVAIVQAVRTSTWRDLSGGVALVVAAGAALRAALPALTAPGTGSLVVFFVILTAICIAGGLPLGFTFGLCTTCYLALTTTVPLSVALNRLDQGMSQSVLLAIRYSSSSAC